MPFYPPYKSSLCYNFSLLINSLPKMTYNNYIFKTMWEEIIEKLIEHSTFEDIDSYNIYFDFI